MALVETEALILKTYKLNDSDKIVVFLARKTGLIRGVANGARRLNSKFGSTLEPFTIVDLVYFQKEASELAKLRDAEMKQSFFHQAGQPNTLLGLSYFTDLLTELIPPHEPDDVVYRMAQACFQVAAESGTASGNASLTALQSTIVYFENWILRLSGYAPQWDRCEHCGRPIPENEPFRVSSGLGVACQNCRNVPAEWTIGLRQKELLRLLRSQPPEKFVDLSSGDYVELRALSSIQQKLISRVLEKDVSLRLDSLAPALLS